MHAGALCKLTLTHLKVWMLRNPWERDNMETLQSHLWIYFTGIIHGWKLYPASLCCWLKTNYIPHTLLYVYICLLVGWGFGIKWEHWNPEKSQGLTALLTSHTFTEIPQNLYRDPDIQSRHAIQTLSISDVNSGRKSQEPVLTVFSTQTRL